MRRRILGAVATIATTAGLFLLTPISPAHAAVQSPALLATCPDTFNVKVSGGEASWTVTCYGGKVYVDGWVKDTAADGKCARVKSLIAGVWHYSAAACPNGDRETFSWSKIGNSAQTYLYVS